MSPLNHTTEDDLDIRMQLLSRRLNNLIAETEDFLAEEQKADKETMFHYCLTIPTYIPNKKDV